MHPRLRLQGHVVVVLEVGMRCSASVIGGCARSLQFSLRTQRLVVRLRNIHRWLYHLSRGGSARVLFRSYHKSFRTKTHWGLSSIRAPRALPCCLIPSLRHGSKNGCRTNVHAFVYPFCCLLPTFTNLAVEVIVIVRVIDDHAHARSRAVTGDALLKRE